MEGARRGLKKITITHASISGPGGEHAPETTCGRGKSPDFDDGAGWNAGRRGGRGRSQHVGMVVLWPSPRGRRRPSPGEHGGAIEAAKVGLPGDFCLNLRTRTARGGARGPGPPGARSREFWIRRFDAGERAGAARTAARGGREWGKSRITWRSTETCLSASAQAPN